MSGSGVFCGGEGCCCSNKGGDAGQIDRRDFLKAAAATAGGLALLGSGRVAWADAPEVQDALREWTAQLYLPGRRKLYRGAELEHLGFPLGGIGAGQVYLAGNGRLFPWQITNNFNSSAEAPGAFFAAWARVGDAAPVARLLEEGDSAAMPGVTAVEYAAEYPYAWLRYLDGQLPVDVSLEAFSPFIPMNTEDSALPAVVFRFTVQNRNAQPVEAAILCSIPNLVGWDGYTKLDGVRHVDYIGNFNALESAEGATLLHMQTRPGKPMSLAEPRELYTDDGRVAYLLRLCGNLSMHHHRPAPIPQEVGKGIVWLGDLEQQGNGAAVGRAIEAASKGAVLIAAPGEGVFALAELADEGAAPMIMFEDWEDGTLERWQVDGTCFGEGPVTGTLDNQQRVTGWRGKYYLNSYAHGDDATGRAVSQPFEITRRFIHLQVGGGNHPLETCVNLKVGGQVVLSATGENKEELRPVRWDVSAYRGQTGQLEIVDAKAGGWGHVLVGDIAFSDSPVAPFVEPDLARRVREALPFTWTRSTQTAEPSPLRGDPPLAQGLPEASAGARRQFDGFALKPGAQVLLEAEDGTPLVVQGPCGNGALLVCNGAILDWFDLGTQKAVAGRLLEAASGVTVTPSTGWDPSSMVYGSMAFGVAPAEGVEVSAQPQWDAPDALWSDFAEDGRLTPGGNEPSVAGRTWNGALSASVRLAAGESKQITFALAWHFPNRTRDDRYGLGPGAFRYDYRLGNHYNTRFSDARDVLAYLYREGTRLDADTRRFHTTYYDSSLPHWMLDGVSANIANLRSPIFIWIEDGFFGGFEGADSCCPMNCTHVYNYAMTTAYLFPDLERNVRETDLLRQMNPERHFIPHRTLLPLTLPRLGDEIGGPLHHALDGELGTVLKTCREWRQSGDSAWLGTVWPNLKLVMEHVLSEHDNEGTGVIRGEQPNTYDTHIFGSNTFIGTLYLAALRATEEMARAMGDETFADVCRGRYEAGREGYDRICWNGEYYENVFDMPGATPETYNQGSCYGAGCHSDQLLGQWWAYLLDLGHVLPPERVKQALLAMYRYNWRPDLADFVHHQRVFAEGHEKGLLTATWPRGGRPQRPILYCDEVWTGLEYEVAALLIYAGELEKGLQLAKGARDRYTGNQRSPFAEVECGHHYARALSSYSLLHAAAGYDYDGHAQMLTFEPKLGADTFRSFFTAGKGWGSIACQKGENGTRVSVRIDYGQVPLRSVRLAGDAAPASVSVQLNGAPVECRCDADGGRLVITTGDGLTLQAGQELVLVFATA